MENCNSLLPYLHTGQHNIMLPTLLISEGKLKIFYFASYLYLLKNTHEKKEADMHLKPFRITNQIELNSDRNFQLEAICFPS